MCIQMNLFYFMLPNFHSRSDALFKIYLLLFQYLKYTLIYSDEINKFNNFDLIIIKQSLIEFKNEKLRNLQWCLNPQNMQKCTCKSKSNFYIQIFLHFGYWISNRKESNLHRHQIFLSNLNCFNTHSTNSIRSILDKNLTNGDND